jgi:hypothetical protein
MDDHRHATTRASASAAAALTTAAELFTIATTADPAGCLVLLTDTAGALCAALHAAGQAITDSPDRAHEPLYGALTLTARQILANARTLATIPTRK